MFSELHPDAEKSDELYDWIERNKENKEFTFKKVIDQHKGFICKLHDETGVEKPLLYDIYIDSVILLFDHIEGGKFNRKSKLSTYLFRVFYFKTIDEVRRSAASKVVYTDTVPDLEDSKRNAEVELEELETTRKVALILDSMSPQCRELILDWAYLGYDLEEIRQRMGFDSPTRFSKFKFTCLKKFRDLWSLLPADF